MSYSVKGTTINKILNDYGLDSIDILKIDIEGAEQEVFGDTSAWIARVGSIIIELHDRFKPGCSSSFYSAIKDFDIASHQGEIVFASNKGYVVCDEA